MKIIKIRETLREETFIPNIAAFCFLVMTLLTAGRYGFYGDELYYIACSKHLDFGYVDHPPLVALLTFIGRWVFGETKFGLRFLSGLAGAVTVLFSAKIAGTLGGGKLSKSLAALFDMLRRSLSCYEQFLLDESSRHHALHRVYLFALKNNCCTFSAKVDHARRSVWCGGF